VADAGVGVGKYLPVLSSVTFLFVSCYPITVKHSQYQFLPIYARRGVRLGMSSSGAAFPCVKSQRGSKVSYSCYG